MTHSAQSVLPLIRCGDLAAGQSCMPAMRPRWLRVVLVDALADALEAAEVGLLRQAPPLRSP
jgi:hypothetical protein